MKTLWIVLRTLFYAACGTFLFIVFVMATSGFDRRFENAFAGDSRPVGILLTALGAVLMLLCMGTFAIRGRGTPLVLDSPREFVASGMGAIPVLAVYEHKVPAGGPFGRQPPTFERNPILRIEGNDFGF